MKNPFALAVSLSLGLHIAVIAGSSSWDFLRPQNKPLKQPKTEFIVIERILSKKEPKPVNKEPLTKPPPYVELKNELLSLRKTKERILKKSVLSRQ